MNASPLIKLPAELRNQIYELVLCPADGIHIGLQDDRPVLQSPPPSACLLALTHACRQIRAECLELLFGSNVFHIHTNEIGWIASTDRSSSTRPHIQAERTMPCYRDPRKRTTHSLVFKWLLAIGESNTASLREVDVVLGTWDTLDNFSVLSTRLPSWLGELSSFFRGTTTACDLSIGLDWTNKAGGGNLGTIRLPLLDLQAARHIIRTTRGDEGRRLGQALKDGNMTREQFSLLGTDLDICRRRLAPFVSLVEAAARGVRYDPFADWSIASRSTTRVPVWFGRHPMTYQEVDSHAATDPPTKSWFARLWSLGSRILRTALCGVGSAENASTAA